MYLFCLQSMRDVVTVGEELRPHRSIPDPTKVVPPSKKLSQVKQEPSLNGHFCCDEYKCGFIWLLVFFLWYGSDLFVTVCSFLCEANNVFDKMPQRDLYNDMLDFVASLPVIALCLSNKLKYISCFFVMKSSTCVWSENRMSFVLLCS